MRWLVGPRSLRRFWPALGTLGPLALRVPPHAFAAQVRAILEMDDDVRFALPSIAVPTLVVVGNQDILTPRGDSEELAELIPDAELVVIAGAAHGLMVEHATTFNRVVLDFLQRTRRSVPRPDARRGRRRRALRARWPPVPCPPRATTSSCSTREPVPGGRLRHPTPSGRPRSTTAPSSSPCAPTPSPPWSRAWEAEGLVHEWCRGFGPIRTASRATPSPAA